MINEVEELCKSLTLIKDFSTLKKGDKIFNRCSLSAEYDTFDHIEQWEEDREIIFYKNNKGELWNGETKDYWYYHEEGKYNN